MFQILVVCTGNLCRSPMAEGILRHLIERQELGDRVEVASAGTWAMDEQPASANAVQAAARRGIRIAEHRSRTLLAPMIRDADLILVMEPVHLEEVLAKAPSAERKAFVLTTFADPFDGDPGGVLDPYGSDPAQYEATFDELDHLMRVAFPRILEFMERGPRPAPSEAESAES